MKLPNLRDRHSVNITIASAVLFHLITVMMASRIDSLWLTQAALFSGIALYSILGPFFWLWHRTTRSAGRLDGLSDIRKAMEEFADLLPYDPTPYFDIKKGLFVGLDLDRNHQPVYVPWHKLHKTHTQVVGTTGSGKGVATTMMLWQCALAGECVVIFDPKFPGDQFGPSVLNRLAHEHNIPFYFVNLSPDLPNELEDQFPQNPPQFNLFAGCSQAQLESMLNTAFCLEEKGTEGDHYRLYDRVANVDVCARTFAQTKQITFHHLVAAANQSPEICAEQGKEKALDYKLKLQQMATLNVINTLQGLDLPAILNQNAILYIIGNYEHDQTLRLQKMLLVRLMQILGKRDRRNKNLRKVAMMLDELKYMLSPGALQSLGLVRDKGCHIFLAHQTLGDLRQCPGLDQQAVTAAVKGNTSIKLIYKITDPDDTGRWAETLSGKIVVLQQSTHMQQGAFHASEGQFRQIERPLLTINELTSLPDLTGMFFGDGLSKRVQVGFMPTGPYPTLTPAPPLQHSKPQAEHTSSTTSADSSSGTPTNMQAIESQSQSTKDVL